MSDLGMPPRGGPPMGAPGPGGPPPMGAPKDAMTANRSIMNPMDTAAMASTGAIKQGMTVRDLIEKVFKVPIDAPVEQLTAAIKTQGQNQTGMGKAAAMGQGAPPGMGAPPPSRMPPGQPSAGPKPPQGIEQLMS